MVYVTTLPCKNYQAYFFGPPCTWTYFSVYSYVCAAHLWRFIPIICAFSFCLIVIIIFEPVAVETLGVFNASACYLLNDLGTLKSGEARETIKLPVPKNPNIGAALQCCPSTWQFAGRWQQGLRIVPTFLISHLIFELPRDFTYNNNNNNNNNNNSNSKCSERHVCMYCYRIWTSTRRFQPAMDSACSLWRSSRMRWASSGYVPCWRSATNQEPRWRVTTYVGSLPYLRYGTTQPNSLWDLLPTR